MTDGDFRPDGTVLHLGHHEDEVPTEAFQRNGIREHAQPGEQVRTLLDLVQDDEPFARARQTHDAVTRTHDGRLARLGRSCEAVHLQPLAAEKHGGFSV
jgi:hypothetical protein